MTLTERLQQTVTNRRAYHHARAITYERAIIDSIAPEWGAEALTPRCAHCGVSGYNVVWRQAYGGVWYAVCSDVASCALRAHGEVN